MYLIIFTPFFLQSFCLASQKEFFDAIFRNNTDTVEQLLKGHPELIHVKRKVFKDGPLHVAIQNNCYEIVIKLLKAGADTEVKDWRGKTPLNLAAMFGLEEIVDLLIKKGAGINQKDNNGYTPLHHAVFNENKKIVLSLLQGGANIFAMSMLKTTPLGKAKEQKNVEIRRILEEHAACAETKTDLTERMAERRLPLKESKLS